MRRGAGAFAPEWRFAPKMNGSGALIARTFIDVVELRDCVGG
jgi:hypothetical protein